MSLLYQGSPATVQLALATVMSKL